MSDTFESRMADLERKMEDILCSILAEKTEAGLAVFVDIMPLFQTFNRTLADLKTAIKSSDIRIKLGDRSNEE